MKISAGKYFIFALSLLPLASVMFAQDSKPSEQSGATATPQQASLDTQQAAPPENTVLFVSPRKGGLTVAFFTTPDGSAVVVPVNEVQQAFQAGYRPVLVADLLRAAGTYMQAIQDQQKKIDDLTAQYNVLVGRFNQLAAANRMDSSTYAKQQAADEKREMRLMLFQSLLARTAPPTQVQMQVQTANCTAYPALCVKH